MKKNRLKHAFTAFFAVSMLTMVPAFADSHNGKSACNEVCEPCKDDCCCEVEWCKGLSFGFDFLYWKPCQSLDYALEIPTGGGVFATGVESTVKHRYLCTDWDPGIRIFITNKECWCNWDLIGSYTYFHSTASDRTSSTVAGGVVPLLIHGFSFGGTGGTGSTAFTEVSVNYKQQYHNFDVLLSKDYCPCPCQTLTPFFGITGLFTNTQYQSEASTESAGKVDFDYKSDLWSLGIKIGTQYTYTICDCFGIFAKADGSLLVGEYDVEARSKNFLTSTNLRDLEFNNSDICVCIPGWHLAIGFEYNDTMCGFDYQTRFGYEFTQWHGLPTPTRYNIVDSDDFGAPSGNRDVVGYHGLFLGFTVSF